ncbi:hypothetical protein CPB83DRAFT_504984 [Crepidotus variabilis]|uniref:Uncharacterized protein n=1 Tax=Crepidotus variabilis TaxID=179855 RepID=A0A9P6EBK2_9AGAR|nr:hypothetical protein CPB83DRAFT_504984 [Crepidotus variabilis]
MSLNCLRGNLEELVYVLEAFIKEHEYLSIFERPTEPFWFCVVSLRVLGSTFGYRVIEHGLNDTRGKVMVCTHFSYWKGTPQWGMVSIEEVTNLILSKSMRQTAEYREEEAESIEIAARRWEFRVQEEKEAAKRRSENLTRQMRMQTLRTRQY